MIFLECIGSRASLSAIKGVNQVILRDLHLFYIPKLKWVFLISTKQIHSIYRHRFLKTKPYHWPSTPKPNTANPKH